jgi:hypothetical protein
MFGRKEGRPQIVRTRGIPVSQIVDRDKDAKDMKVGEWGYVYADIVINCDRQGRVYVNRHGQVHVDKNYYTARICREKDGFEVKADGGFFPKFDPTIEVFGLPVVKFEEV